jgi:hypothetical protein
MCSLTVWNCDNRGLTEIPTEFPDTLLNLFLRGNTISRIDDAAFKDLPNLEVIDISENNITVIHHRAFQELPRLKRLILRGNPQLQDLQPSVFHDLPMLSIIRLDSCNITTLSPGRFTKLPMLKELDFSHNAGRMRGARARGGGWSGVGRWRGCAVATAVVVRSAAAKDRCAVECRIGREGGDVRGCGVDGNDGDIRCASAG